MSKIIKSAMVLSLAFSVTACATSSKNIEANYVPSTEYSGRSCSSLNKQFKSVNKEVRVLSASQDAKAKADGGTAALSAILFWPALFFIKGDGKNRDSIAELKGQYNAIKLAAETKKCSFIKDAPDLPTSTKKS
ncbi:MAG: hypothetical protein HRU28_09010 [Rhizobiales bacterium]|nr:hypothetical protein [Hyphomicrobiales bacterium]